VNKQEKNIFSMTKILRKYTTIPSHLYVKRNADNQLKQIIEEMDRPGYVLVARQMGKTNLLFNVKRELENENTLFAYIDLSNVFDIERDCYRNIIDTILDSNSNLLSDLSELVRSDRKSIALPPHKEHINELRKILNYFKGKIIIILDEIDALRSATYSDKIFAQIRSNYFARTTFPEFENLTYILSGVIEPTELIKDRNKSPFNIGEKIYLDDFTFEEHCIFIKKSQLPISTDISKEIFEWTNGNPRLTFDICSEIEDWYAKNESITKEELEKLIAKKYLIAFDIAPVDHIRELVSTNTTVRNAIINLRKGINHISSEVKSKLYLFGIISSDFENVKIKNKIIDNSLSEEWLLSIEKQSKSLFELGSDSILKGIDIDGGILMLSDYLDSDLNIPNAQKQLSLYYIGYGYHLKRLYAESNIYLKQQIISQDISNDLHYRQKLFIGLNHLSLREYEEGEKYIVEIISDYKNSPPYLNALLNLSQSLIERDYKGNKVKALELLSELILNADNVELDMSDKLTINELKTLAYYYISSIYLKNENYEEALSNIDLALNLAGVSHIPELLFFKFFADGNKNINILSEIIDVIIKNNLQVSIQQNSEISFSETNIYSYLIVLHSLSQDDLFQRLFNYVCNDLCKIKKNAWDIYNELANYTTDDPTSIYFYERVLEFEAEIQDSNLLYNTYRILSLASLKNEQKFKHYLNYYTIYFENNDSIIELQDITVFANAIKFYSDKNNILKGLELCDLINTKLTNLPSDLEFESLIIYYWYSNLYYSLKNSFKASFHAEKTLELINKYKDKNKRGSFIDEKGVKIIFEQMHQIKNSLIIRKPIVIDRQYERNDIVHVLYVDGKEIKAKYKKIEADIIAERCKIIDS